MFLIFLFFSASLITVQGGELLIAKHPSSISFHGKDTIDQSALPDVFSAALGLTPENNVDWYNMNIREPFGFAEAIVVLHARGIASLGDYAIQKYPLNGDEDAQETWENIKHSISERNKAENNSLVKLDFEVSADLDKIPNIILNKHSEQDSILLNEIDGLKQFSESVEKAPGTTNLYWFNINGLDKLFSSKEFDESVTKGAKHEVYKSLVMLAEKFSSLYAEHALVVGLITDVVHIRKTRSVQEENVKNSNVTEKQNNIYDPDFPAIFNIILWFTLALVFSLLAVSVFIATMDPGRDSIIYRMTSNRMKKDS